MSLLDAGYVNKQTAVEIRASLAGGWSRKGKSYGYSEQFTLDFSGDYKMRVAVTVLPRPSGFHEAARTFPVETECRGGVAGIDYQLTNGNLRLLVQLMINNNECDIGLPWIITSNNKLAIHWIECPIAVQNGTNFELQLAALDLDKGERQIAPPAGEEEGRPEGKGDAGADERAPVVTPHPKGRAEWQQRDRSNRSDENNFDARDRTVSTRRRPLVPGTKS